MASHLMGGYFTYKYIGNNKYSIEIAVYRDCKGAPMPTSLNVYYKDADPSGTQKNYLQIFRKGPVTKPQNNTASCASEYCIEKGVFSDTVLLGPSPAGYDFWVNLSARNASILNIAKNNAGMTWYAFIPARKYQNSSPLLLKDPVPIICANTLTRFSAGIYDPDGDSLVFSLVKPYNGTGTPGFFGTVTYNNGYSVDYPFGISSPAIFIDKISGEITAEPMVTGNYVIAIEVNEYRVDPLTHTSFFMGQVRIDLQFIATQCKSNSPPYFDKDNNMQTRFLDVGKPFCLTITGHDDSRKTDNSDQVTLSASSTVFGNQSSFPQPYAIFKNKTADTLVSSTFCWTPSCDHITLTSPHLVTFRLEDKGCNTVEQTWKIYVRYPYVPPPRFDCVSIIDSNKIELRWNAVKFDSTFGSYNIYRKVANRGTDFIKVGSVNSGAAYSWTDQNADSANSIAYDYFITSTNRCNKEGNTSDTLRSIIIRSTKQPDGSIDYTWRSVCPKLKGSYIVEIDTSGSFEILSKQTGESISFNHCRKNFRLRVTELRDKAACYSISNITELQNPYIKSPPIISASVEKTSLTAGTIKLKWEHQDGWDITGYRIQRSTNGIYWYYIAQTGLTESYIDTGLSTGTKSYYYRLKPTDTCGTNIPNFCIPHKTILLKVVAHPGRNELVWSPYMGFTPASYEIYRNGVPYKSVNGDQTTFNDEFIICSTVYNYFVKAEDEAGSSIYSMSNTDSIVPAPDPSTAPYLRYVTVNDSGQVEMAWEPSLSYDQRNYFIYCRVNEGAYQLIDSTLRLTYIDRHPVFKSALSYYIAVRNTCRGDGLKSNEGSVIILNGKHFDDRNEIGWNAYKEWRNGVNTYKIVKKTDKLDPEQVADLTILKHTDYFLTDTFFDYCYQVTVTENNSPELSRSTIWCARRSPLVWVPNAFTPDGNALNEDFGPKANYPLQYNMQIFNRWGEEVYSTTLSKPWDGRFKGQIAEDGSYFYIMRIQGEKSDEVIFRKGTVHLTR